MDLDVRHDELAHKYSARVEGEEAVLSYRETGEGTVEFTRTFVPEELRGRGIGEDLVRQALDDAAGRGWRFTASCPFVRKYLERHPELQEAAAGSRGGA
jgi:uncharacterized protein